MTRFSVKAGDEGKRIDKYLVEVLKGVSRNSIKELLDMGRVKINGKRVVIAKWELLEGDEVEVEEKKLAFEEVERRESKRYFIKVIHEDRDVIVVEKPAGAVIQAGEEHGGAGTFVDSIREYLKRKHGGKGSFVKAVHRLDKDTSGIMVFAKSKVGEKLIEQFKKHDVERAYLAVVEGLVGRQDGVVDFPISKGDFGHGKRANISRDGQGLKATTKFQVKERYSEATLLRLDLLTGRTHQARVHMAAIGHPIVGDRTYGKPGGISFRRQALHSHVLGFNHPASGKRVYFSSELPEDIKQLIDRLRNI